MSLGPEADAASWFFFIALAVLSILMVLALMRFTLALVATPERPAARPRGLAELRAALLALNTPERKFRLVPVSDTELRLDWAVVDASWYRVFAAVKLTMIYRARLLLYESAHEVRCHETLRSANYFIGFEGVSGLRSFIPRFSFHFSYRSGALNVIWTGRAYGLKKAWSPRIGEVSRFTLDTVAAKQAIAAAARKVGWAFRPVLFRFETSARGAALAERLVPRFARDWSRMRVWGSIYGASWAGILGLLMASMPWTGEHVLIVALIAGVFFVGQALFVWYWRFVEGHFRRRAARRHHV